MVEGLGEVAQVLAFGAEVGHQPRLVLRAQLGVHVDDARFRGQGGRGGGVVTGQHRHPVPGAAQPVDDLGGLGTQLVTHRDRTDDAPIVLDEHRGGAHLLHALDIGGPARRVPAAQRSGRCEAVREVRADKGGRQPRSGGQRLRQRQEMVGRSGLVTSYTWPGWVSSAPRTAALRSL